MLSEKHLAELDEEAGANTDLFDAVASICDVRQLPSLFVHEVDSPPLSFMLRDDGVSALLISSCDVDVHIAGSWASVYRDVVDPSMS